MTKEFTVAAITIFAIFLIGSRCWGALFWTAIIYRIILIVMVAVTSCFTPSWCTDTDVIVSTRQSRRTTIECVGHSSTKWLVVCLHIENDHVTSLLNQQDLWYILVRHKSFPSTLKWFTLPRFITIWSTPVTYYKIFYVVRISRYIRDI